MNETFLQIIFMYYIVYFVEKKIMCDKQWKLKPQPIED